MSSNIMLDQEALSRIRSRNEKLKFYRENVNEDFAREVAKSASLFPSLSPSSILNLTRAGASPRAFAKLNELKLQQEAENRVDEDDSGGFKIPSLSLYGGLKRTTRYALLLGDLGSDIASSMITPGVGFGEAFRASKLGVRMSGVDPGSGFFPSDEFTAEQESIATELRSRSPETQTTQVITVMENGVPVRKVVPAGITVGRAVRDKLGIRVDSVWGNTVSGLIDGFVNVALDPTIGLAKVAGAAKVMSRGMKTANYFKRAGLEAPEGIGELYRLGKEWSRAPDTAYEMAKIKAIRGATTPQEVAEVLAVRAGNEVAPDAPRWLRDGEATWTQLPNGKWTVVDDLELERMRGDLAPDEVEAIRQARAVELSEVKQTAETVVWNQSRAMAVLKQDPRAQFIIRTIAEMDIEAPGLAHRIRRDVFRGRISLEDADMLARVARSSDDLDEVEEALRRTMGEFYDRLSRPDTPDISSLSLFGSATRQARYGVRDLYSDNPTERFFADGEIRRMFGVAPNRSLHVLGGSRARMQAVDDFERFVDLALPDASRLDRLKLVDEFMSRITYSDDVVEGTQNAAGEVVRAGGTRSMAYTTSEIIDDVVTRMVREEGLSEAAAQKLLNSRQRIRDDLRSWAAKSAADGGGINEFQALRRLGLFDDEEIIAGFGRQGIFITREAIDDLKSVGPELLSDLLDNVVLLPDVDLVRGVTRNPFFKKTIGRAFRNPDSGEARVLLRGLDFVANDVWKKFILFQAAYLVRNLLEGQARMWMSGHTSMYNNPLKWVSYYLSSPGANRAARALGAGPRGLMDILGKPISAKQAVALERGAISDLSKGDEWLARTANSQQWEIALGPSAESTARQAEATGGWVAVGWTPGATRADEAAVVGRTGRPNPHTEGMLDQARKINLDPMQNIYIKFASITDPGARKRAVLEWLYSTPEGSAARKELLDLYYSGMRVTGVEGGQIAPKIRPTRTLSDFEERQFLELKLQEVAERSAQIDRMPEMVVMAAANRIPIINPATGRASIQAWTVDTRLKQRLFGSQAKTTTIPDIPESYVGRTFDYVIEGEDGKNVTKHFFVLSADDSSGTMRIAVIETKPPDKVAWSLTGRTENYADDAVKIIDDLKTKADLDQKAGDSTLYDLIPKQVGWAVRVDPNDPGELEKLQNSVRSLGEIVFQGTYEGDSRLGRWWSKNLSTGRKMTSIEKIPFVRQRYYVHVMDNIRSLSYEEAVKVRDDILDLSRQWKMDPEDVMGEIDRGAWNNLNAILDQGPGGKWGTYTLVDLDAYAKARSVTEMQDLFFDASTRTNFDANLGMRINFAFVAAWANIITDMGILMAKKPTKPYKLARAIDAGSRSQSNPERREGAFRKDPQSGEYVFSLPLYDSLYRQIFGLGADFSAPLKGLNVGLQVVPALNPIGNFSASKILGLVSALGGDWGRGLSKAIENTFMPYGRIDTASEVASSAIPASWRKVLSAIESNPDRVAGTFGRNYVEILMVKAGSGEYDLNNEDSTVRTAELERLEKDAHAAGIGATMLEALSGFLGPAAGNARFMVQTSSGEHSVVYLAKVLQDLREQDYETAIPKFLAAFGPTVEYLVAGKNKTLIPGLSPTEPFMEFQQKHGALFDKYRTVAGYLAPEGDTFSNAAWAYQVEKGYTTPLKGIDMVRSNEYAIGAALYRQERNRFPTFLTDEQQIYLKAFRQQLNKEYPGYPVKPSYDVAAFDNFLVKIAEAIEEPEWRDLPISRAIGVYLGARDVVLGNLRAKYGDDATFRSKRATSYREQMRRVAAKIAEENPEFARIYDRQFAQEVSLVGESTEPSVNP